MCECVNVECVNVRLWLSVWMWMWMCVLMPVPTLAGTLCDSMSTDILLLPYIEDSKKERKEKMAQRELNWVQIVCKKLIPQTGIHFYVCCNSPDTHSLTACMYYLVCRVFFLGEKVRKRKREREKWDTHQRAPSHASWKDSLCKQWFTLSLLHFNKNPSLPVGPVGVYVDLCSCTVIIVFSVENSIIDFEAGERKRRRDWPQRKKNETLYYWEKERREKIREKLNLRNWIHFEWTLHSERERERERVQC